MKKDQADKAKKFLDMHHSSKIMVLPNAWDVFSAKIYEHAGFKAIGTTSAGIAATLGFPDGERMSLQDNLRVSKRIVENTNLPVSIDAETGYAESAEAIAETAQAVIDIGAVGLNIEDGTGNKENPLFDVSVMCERIAAIRDRSLSNDIHLVINARTDVYLSSRTSPAAKFEETILRAHAYKKAGADCIFAPSMPGVLDEGLIAQLVKSIHSPVNIISDRNSPSLSSLEEIGVSRVSLGPRPMRACMALLKTISQEIMQSGTFTSMDDSEISYSDVNKMFEPEQ